MDDQLRRFQIIQERLGFSRRPNPARFIDLALRLGLPPYNYDQNIGQSTHQALLFNNVDGFGAPSTRDYQ
ncbi:hypothetical protein TorRG33x02_030750, partial [Trema orientale]